MRILSDPKKSPPNKSYDMEVEARAGPGGHEARSPPEDRLNRLADVFPIKRTRSTPTPTTCSFRYLQSALEAEKLL